MLQYTKLSIQRLNQAELVQLMTRSMDILDKKQVTISDDMAASLVSRIKRTLPSLKATLKAKPITVSSKEIKAATKLRNSDRLAFFHALQAYQSTRSQDKQKAYQQLISLWNQYKTISGKNAKEACTLVSSFLDKLGTDHYSNAIEDLNLAEFMENLKTSQAALYNLYLLRSQTKAESVSINSDIIRQAITADYKLLYNHLYNKVSFNPDDDSKNILSLLDDIRKEFQLTIKRRSTKKATLHTEVAP